jgi:Uma2 family endonuclease
MQTLTSEKIYTYADYLTWQLDECVELLRGKILKMSPAPLRKHQKISTYLQGELYAYFKKQKCEISQVN